MGVIGLKTLKKHNFNIMCVFTYKDDKNENIWFESVENWCIENNINYYTPNNVNSQRWIEMIKSLSPDIIFSFYYRNLICKDILKIPRYGAINLHGSLLPKYRGRAPVNWAILNGEKYTGVTLHYMVEKADAGDIIAQRQVKIDFYDTAKTLFGKLQKEAEILLEETLPLIKQNKVKPIKQNEKEATYFGKRSKEDGLIDFNKSAMEIYNLIRAVTKPYPGAFTYYKSEELIIWWALPTQKNLNKREIRVENGMVYIGTGEGSLELHEIEYKGKIYRKEEISNILKGGYL